MNNDDTSTNRWDKAQSVEKKYWKDHRHADEFLIKFWTKVLKKGYDLDFNFFNNKDVLEVGASPSGMIFSLPDTKSKIGIEPMDTSDIVVDWKKEILRVGKGEDMPITNSSVDIVICFNVLDHTLNPEDVIDSPSPVATFSVNGPHFGDRYGITNELLHALKENHIDLLALNCTIASIIGVVPSNQIEQVIQAIQGCFDVPSITKKED